MSIGGLGHITKWRLHSLGRVVARRVFPEQLVLARQCQGGS